MPSFSRLCGLSLRLAIILSLPLSNLTAQTILLPVFAQTASPAVTVTKTTSTPNWGTFTLPPSASAAITFVANIPTNQPLGNYQNPVNVTYDGTSVNPTNAKARFFYYEGDYERWYL
jgi:hypothetical protein